MFLWFFVCAMMTPHELNDCQYWHDHQFPISTVISGGSRISPRRGRQLPRGGAPTYDFAKISQKLHEIERIWGKVMFLQASVILLTGGVSRPP